MNEYNITNMSSSKDSYIDFYCPFCNEKCYQTINSFETYITYACTNYLNSNKHLYNLIIGNVFIFEDFEIGKLSTTRDSALDFMHFKYKNNIFLTVPPDLHTKKIANMLLNSKKYLLLI